jgi:hypothetical protein
LCGDCSQYDESRLDNNKNFEEKIPLVEDMNEEESVQSIVQDDNFIYKHRKFLKVFMFLLSLSMFFFFVFLRGNVLIKSFANIE